jgi:hypothetical protein
MLTRGTMTIIMGVLAVLFSPALLGVAAILFAMTAILLCPRLFSQPNVDCRDCHSHWCGIALAIVMFGALPLCIVSVYLLTRRKAPKS